MQNDALGSVAGQELCVTLYWYKKNGKADGSDGYAFIVYIQEAGGGMV
jgi:hypothetical protein